MKTRVLVIAVVAMATTSLTACSHDIPDCVNVTFAGKATIQSVDKATGERILLYPVALKFNGFGAPTSYTEVAGRTVHFQDELPDGIRMFLPAGDYTFSGPWTEGSCNPKFTIKP